LTRLTNALGASTLASFSYGYDHDWTSGSDTMLGQRTSMTANVPAQGLTAAESRYSYDPLYQLVKAQYPAGAVFGGETHEWTYDALGNRLSSKVNGTGPSYTYFKNGTNPLNGQRLSSDGANSYTYDANGSQLTRTGSGGNYGFGYDPDKRLASITGAETASYTYDYQGRRTSKTEAGVTTTYLYDGLNPIGETIAGVPRYVLNGPSIDEPLAISASGTISYLNADGLGSIVATNTTAGTVTHSLSFDAWGVPRSETGARTHGFTYTGREVGVAGMHFYRARFVQAGVGRFTQEDPLRSDLLANAFSYVSASPLSFIDPRGLRKTIPWFDALAHIHALNNSTIPDAVFLCLMYREATGPGYTIVTDQARKRGGQGPMGLVQRTVNDFRRRIPEFASMPDAADTLKDFDLNVSWGIRMLAAMLEGEDWKWGPRTLREALQRFGPGEGNPGGTSYAASILDCAKCLGCKVDENSLPSRDPFMPPTRCLTMAKQ